MAPSCCAYCDEESNTLRRCSGCRKVWYCSVDCHEKHWKDHIFSCKIGHISTVYHLSRSIRGDEIPMHAQTRIDYGFDKAQKSLGVESETMLCGLYQGLLIYCEVEEKELRIWQKEGRLVDGIKAAFETLPPNNRGGYYRWFLEHQGVLDGSRIEDPHDPEEEAASQVRAMTRDGWVATGGSPNDSDDEIKAQLENLSAEKQMCFQFYSLLRAGLRPSPSTTFWKTFGFVAASSPSEEHHYAMKYMELFRHCTFSEFCTAYETSSMVALFSHHGIPSPSAYFTDVMSGSPRQYKSVWSLKQYIDQLISHNPDSGEPPQPVPSVLCDYGFMNCKNTAERKLLNDMYTHLFQQPGMDPLALHEACIKGKVFEFVKGLVKLPGSPAKYKRLLKNPYPLPDLETLNI